MIFAGETEVLGENLPSAILSTTNPTWIDPGAKPGLRGERPATNRLRHDTATLFLCTLNYIKQYFYNFLYKNICKMCNKNTFIFSLKTTTVKHK
jgi:hypothetical protein